MVIVKSMITIINQDHDDRKNNVGHSTSKDHKKDDEHHGGLKDNGGHSTSKDRKKLIF